MKKPSLLVLFGAFLFSCLDLCLALDSDNLQDQDTCPAATSTGQAIFINGFPCKSPANTTASDFKSSKLSFAGDTNNSVRSLTTIATAAEFPGLNGLGLAVARTDLEMDGLVMPHSHPRASELFFVSKGVVIAGFTDTKNQLFQSQLRAGDVFVFPRGLLHYCLNNGFEPATAFSVLNSQNPGLVSISSVMFALDDSSAIIMLKKRLISLSSLQMDRIANASLFRS